MDSINILQLNDDCLGLILRYLQMQDHINLAQVCTRLRHLVKDWSHVIYPTFYINEIVNEEFDLDYFRQQLILFGIISENIKDLEVSINHANYHLYNSKQECLLDNQLVFEEVNQKYFNKYRKMEQEPCELIPFQKFADTIRNMQSLESCTIRKVSFFNIPNLKIINETILALKDLPVLSTLRLSTKPDIDTQTLCQVKNIDNLQLYGTIKVESLVEYCKSNTNLRTLSLLSTRVLGRLCDIVPHCPQLEEISFRLQQNSEAYLQLSELPNLKTLIIRNLQEEGNLTRLFETLKSLHCLKTVETLVNLEETKQIIQISSLRELQQAFDDPKAVEMLAELSELRKLNLKFHGSGDFSAACLKILRSNRKLQFLRIDSKMPDNFRVEALKVIKSIRNAVQQNPLRIELPDAKALTPEEELLMDENYVTLNR